MKCPYCLENFIADWTKTVIGSDSEGEWYVSFCNCSNEKCEKLIVELENTKRVNVGGLPVRKTKSILVLPKAISRSPLSSDVPDIFAQDYLEACLVLADSSKASAALSRRCLQSLLENVAKVKKDNLNNEIEEVLGNNSLPSFLSKPLDAVRNIGNFAVHPIKSTNTGEIVDVEPEEAEWLLDVLEGLFDFYFVQPALIQKKKDELNQKLRDAGKPEMQ